ncbi:MAG: nucleoside triphosphate pyrophosphohydrolase [Candidatus Omnitrophota bacterium]
MKHLYFDKLIKLMARLRAKGGCPWDRAQTHASIKKYLIEEAYEVCDVIDKKDMARLQDELGDLLFQSIFHAQIASERGDFNIDDVLRTSYEKMMRRHPHVFGTRKARNQHDAYKRWEQIKKTEKSFEEPHTLMRGIPRHLPALLKSQKVLKRAAMNGFDWKNMEGALKKAEEELREVRAALKSGNKRRAQEELGDALLALANIGRRSHIDAEEALGKATEKFARRFKKLEAKLEKNGRKVSDCTLKELLAQWNAAK